MIWRLADGAKMMTMMYVQLEDGETNVGDNSDRRWWMRCDAKGTHAPCDGLDKLDADAAGASDLVRKLRCYKRVSAAVVAMVQLRHLPPSPTLDCMICCAPMDRLPLCMEAVTCSHTKPGHPIVSLAHRVSPPLEGNVFFKIVCSLEKKVLDIRNS